MRPQRKSGRSGWGSAGAAVLAAGSMALLVAACSGSSGGGAGGRTATPTASASASPSPTTRLQRAAFSARDLPGYQVSEAQPLVGPGRPQAGRPACQPLADAIGGGQVPGAKETVRKGLFSTAAANRGAAVAVGLSEYAPRQARTVLSRLRAAVGACAPQFTATAEGQRVSYSRVREQRTESAASAGDDALRFTATVALPGGQQLPMDIIVVRKGATVATFVGTNVGDPAHYSVPSTVIATQLAKL